MNRWANRAGAGPSSWPPKAGTSARASTSGQRGAGHRRAVPGRTPPLRGAAPRGGRRAGGGDRGWLRAPVSAGFRLATPGSRFSANFACLGFHHGFLLDGDAARHRRPAGRGRPPAHRTTGRGPARRSPSACATGSPPTARASRWVIRARLRGGAGRRRPAGGPLHPGDAAPRPGGGGPVGHGARVRRAAAPARQRRLRRGRAGGGRAPGAPVQRVMSIAGPAVHDLNTAFSGATPVRFGA